MSNEIHSDIHIFLVQFMDNCKSNIRYPTLILIL